MLSITQNASTKAFEPAARRNTSITVARYKGSEQYLLITSLSTRWVCPGCRCRIQGAGIIAATSCRRRCALSSLPTAAWLGGLRGALTMGFVPLIGAPVRARSVQ